MIIDIKQWNFSSHKQCELCECEPIDYWEMSYIEYKDKMLWICTNCLGHIVEDMQIIDKYGNKV